MVTRACNDLPIRDLDNPCPRCPSRVSCLLKVQPERTEFTGVAGGFRWSAGRLMADSVGANAAVLHEYWAIEGSRSFSPLLFESVTPKG